jgi:hypothetical protein
MPTTGAERLPSAGYDLTVKFGTLHKALHTISADSHDNIGDTVKFLSLRGP